MKYSLLIISLIFSMIFGLFLQYTLFADIIFFHVVVALLSATIVFIRNGASFTLPLFSICIWFLVIITTINTIIGVSFGWENTNFQATYFFPASIFLIAALQSFITISIIVKSSFNRKIIKNFIIIRSMIDFALPTMHRLIKLAKIHARSKDSKLWSKISVRLSVIVVTATILLQRLKEIDEIIVDRMIFWDKATRKDYK